MFCSAVLILFFTVLQVYRTCYNWLLNACLATFTAALTLFCSLHSVQEPYRPESVVTTAIGLGVGLILICGMLRDYELQNRHIATFGSDLASQKKSASVLDSLPDGIIIADSKQINYLNQEAWKLLGCQSTQDDCANIEDIVCLDTKNCSIMTPLEQLINFLTAVDRRIADIDRDSFLSDMIQLATDDAMLLHMHQGLVNPCD